MAESTNDLFGKKHLKEFLLQLFHRLEQANVKYCVLRNYQMIPEGIENDVDMLVLPKDRLAFERCILDSAKATGWSLLMKPVRYGYRSYWFQSTTSGRYVHFDAWTKIAWKGLRWANEAKILSRRIRRKQFYIPCASDEACISLIKDLIQLGNIKEKYKNLITSMLRQDKMSLIKALGWGLGKSLSTKLCDLIEEGKWSEIAIRKDEIRKRVFIECVRRKPISPIIGMACFFGGYIWSLISHRSGIFIAFIGPDGSGKTTIANMLLHSMRDIFPSTQCYHGRFGILPDMRTLYNKLRMWFGYRPLPEAGAGTAALHDMTPHGVFRALAYLGYYAIDYILGFWHVNQSRAKGQMIVFDRYYYDYYVSPLFAKIPRFLLSAVGWIIPKPDMLLYLNCDADAIHQRKPELTPAQIRYQQQEIERYLSNLDYYYMINSEGNLAESVNNIERLIVSALQKRNYKGK